MSTVLSVHAERRLESSELQMLGQQMTQMSGMDEVKHLRRGQAKTVMPLIGPLLDAWEGLPEDLRNEIEGIAPTLAANLEAIDLAMEGDRNGND